MKPSHITPSTPLDLKKQNKQTTTTTTTTTTRVIMTFPVESNLIFSRELI
jgi:hypothetical protein